jgi:serine/threonine protein kinase
MAARTLPYNSAAYSQALKRKQPSEESSPGGKSIPVAQEAIARPAAASSLDEHQWDVVRRTKQRVASKEVPQPEPEIVKPEEAAGSNDDNEESLSETERLFFEKTYERSLLELGKGGYGSVYAGRKYDTGSPVAIKNNDDDKAPNYDEPLTLTVLKEAEVRHRLNIRDTYELPDENLAVVTDLVPGQNLSAVKKRLSFADIVTIAREVLEYLQDLKKINYLHADIKPCNIMYELLQRYVTMLDNGLSYDLDNEDFRDRLIQSSYYRAPEVTLKGPVDASTDLWSLGCTLFELMTGFSLFPVADDARDIKISDDIRLQVIAHHLGGIPPVELLNQCRERNTFFKFEAGRWEFINRNTVIQIPWQEYIRQAARKKNMGAPQVEQFIQLLEGMLKYQNRASADELLSSPLFKEDVSFHLKHNCALGDTIKIFRICEMSEVDYEPEPDLQITAEDKVTRTCFHIPRDPNNIYIVQIEKKDGSILFHTVQLKDGDDLDLTGLVVPAKGLGLDDVFSPDAPPTAILGEIDFIGSELFSSDLTAAVFVEN